MSSRFHLSYFSYFLLLAVSVSALRNAMLAQAGGKSTPRPPSNMTRPDSIQDTGVYNYWTYMTAQERAAGALLGKVTVEGEPLLWEPILVTVNCNGAPVQTTQTDPKGNFLIVPTNIPGALSLQGDAKRQMEGHYEGCVVQSAFPGFHSTTVTITQHNLRDDPQLGTIELSREGGRAAGAAVSSTTESAPAAAAKSFEKARTEMLEQKPDRAQRELKKAVEIYPNFAEAWYQLGKLQLASDGKEARNSFAHALAADTKFILTYEQLAALSSQSGDWQEVASTTDHALQLEPLGTPRTWYLNALANFQLGKTDVAQASATKALTMDPSHTVPNTEQLLAVILARKADYPGALAHLRNCLTYAPTGPNSELLKEQIAQLEQRAAGNKVGEQAGAPK